MKRSQSYSLATALFIGIGGLWAVPAAAETDADFSRYCRTTYPNSAPTTRAPSGAIAHYCNQGGTLQGIDLARACELTTGNRGYRMLGTRTLCADGSGPSQAAPGETLHSGDFARYCRERFPNSIYQDVPDNFGGRHHCRRPGGVVGFTLQRIDLADACNLLKGTTAYREESGRVNCTPAATRQTVERRAVATGRVGPNPNPDAPQSFDSGRDRADAGDNNSPDGTMSKTAPSGRLTGLWTMTTGTLPGMTIRFDWSDNRLTGTIAHLPPATARAANTHYDLKIGDAVVVGQMTGTELKLRTRLGVVGSAAWVDANCAASAPLFHKARANRWSFPGWFPVYRMTLTDARIKGQHVGFELIAPRKRISSRCIINNDPFNPTIQGNEPWIRAAGGIIRAAPIEVDATIRLPKWAIKFELQKVDEPGVLVR
jgi:hypothetical protein